VEGVEPKQKPSAQSSIELSDLIICFAVSRVIPLINIYSFFLSRQKVEEKKTFAHHHKLDEGKENCLFNFFLATILYPN